jgi:hypothetical protein
MLVPTASIDSAMSQEIADASASFSLELLKVKVKVSHYRPSRLSGNRKVKASGFSRLSAL